MNMKNVMYWVFLSLFSAIILTSVWNYVFHFEETIAHVQKLGYPKHLIHPLIVAQILGLTIIILNKGKWLIEWAYAGFFFNLIFAVIAHYAAKEGNGAAAVVAMILLLTTYLLNKQRKYEREFNQENVKSLA